MRAPPQRWRQRFASIAQRSSGAERPRATAAPVDTSATTRRDVASPRPPPPAAVTDALWRLLYLVGRPVAGREHLHRELDLAEVRLVLLGVRVEVGLVVDADREVVQHALHLARELRAAAQLELADHQPLRVVRRRALVQQPLRQLVAVDLRKEVLVRQVPVCFFGRGGARRREQEVSEPEAHSARGGFALAI